MKIFYQKEAAGLTHIERLVVAYIEADPAAFENLKIDQLAKNAAVSIGMVTRLAKKLGYRGFRDMQISVARQNARHRLYELDKDRGTPAGAINNVHIYNRMALETTADSLSPNDIKVFADLLLGASDVYVYGVGASALPALYMEQTLNILGFTVRRPETVHDFVLWPKLERKDRTLFVLFSNTGRTNEINAVLRLAKDYGIMTVFITSSRVHEEHVKMLRINYRTYETEDVDAVEVLTPKIAQLYIVDVVLAVLMPKVARKESISREYLGFNAGVAAK